jgi:hypothetical protein
MNEQEVIDRPPMANFQVPTNLAQRTMTLLTTLQLRKEQATDVDIKQFTPLPAKVSARE